MTTAPEKTADQTTPPVEDAGEALARLDEAMQIIDRWMPSSRFKVRLLHSLTLYVADLRWKEGRRICKRCGVVWCLTKGESAWCLAHGLTLPVRCRGCRQQRRAAREAG